MITLKSIRVHFFGLLLCAVGAYGGGAQSQSMSQPQPPVLSTVDENGVNLATGLPNVPGLNVGAGNDGSGIGRQVQGYLLPNGAIPSADNFSATMTANFIGFTSDQNGIIGRETIYASYGGVTHQFVLGGGHQNSITYGTGPYKEWGLGGNGVLSCSGTSIQVQALQGTCTLTLGDGTSVYYNAGYMQTVTKPDGEVITASYNANNSVNLISSTLGWTLKYNLDSNFQVLGVTAVNTSVSPCTAGSCVPPTGSMAGTSTLSGATRTLWLNGVNIGSYTTGSGSFTINSPSGIAKTYALITALTNHGKVSSVSHDGQTWLYSYSTDGTVTTMTEPNGKTRKLTTDTTGSKILSQTDEAGRVTTYGYDGNDRLNKVINPDGSDQQGVLRFTLTMSAAMSRRQLLCLKAARRQAIQRRARQLSRRRLI